MACILVIDDDPELRDIMRRVLEGAGYTVLEARTGREGLHHCQTSPIALVITDMFLPDHDGVDLLRALQTWVPVPKIIAISGGGRLRDREALVLARELGADRVWHKPVSLMDLLATVRALLAGDSDASAR